MQYVSANTLLSSNMSDHFRFYIPTNSLIFSFRHNQIVGFLPNAGLMTFPYNIRSYIDFLGFFE